MKILMVKNNPMKRDGITSVIYNLIQASDARIVTFDLAAINEPDPSLREAFETIGVRIHILPRSAKRIFRYISDLRRLIRDGRYDAVHIHGSSGTLALELTAAWLAGCKKRISHSHSTSCKYKILHYCMKPLVRLLSTNSLACSDTAGKWLYGSRTFEVIQNGVDIARFTYSEENRQAVRQRLCLSQEDLVVGHVGAFTEVKNQAFLLDILKSLPENYKLVFLGEGAQREQVEEKSKTMGLTDRVTFTGAVADPERYYSAFDVMTLPSRYEGLPLTLIEAQANGLPCVVSDCVTREAAITNRVVFLPIDQGVNIWAEHIRKLPIKNRELAAVKAVEDIEQKGFDINQTAEKLKAYYFEAVET